MGDLLVSLTGRPEQLLGLRQIDGSHFADHPVEDRDGRWIVTGRINAESLAAVRELGCDVTVVVDEAQLAEHDRIVFSQIERYAGPARG